VDGRRR